MVPRCRMHRLAAASRQNFCCLGRASVSTCSCLVLLRPRNCYLASSLPQIFSLASISISNVLPHLVLRQIIILKRWLDIYVIMVCYVHLRSSKSITVCGLFMRQHRARLSGKNFVPTDVFEMQQADLTRRCCTVQIHKFKLF
jgi:hypothetical protein